jgi:hypothetical protein
MVEFSHLVFFDDAITHDNDLRAICYVSISLCLFGAGLYDFIVPMWRFLFQAKYFIAIGCQFFHQTIGSMNPKKMALI